MRRIQIVLSVLVLSLVLAACNQTGQYQSTMEVTADPAVEETTMVAPADGTEKKMAATPTPSPKVAATPIPAGEEAELMYIE